MHYNTENSVLIKTNTKILTEYLADLSEVLFGNDAQSEKKIGQFNDMPALRTKINQIRDDFKNEVNAQKAVIFQPKVELHFPNELRQPLLTMKFDDYLQGNATWADFGPANNPKTLGISLISQIEEDNEKEAINFEININVFLTKPMDHQAIFTIFNDNLKVKKSKSRR